MKDCINWLAFMILDPLSKHSRDVMDKDIRGVQLKLKGINSVFLDQLHASLLFKEFKIHVTLLV